MRLRTREEILTDLETQLGVLDLECKRLVAHAASEVVRNYNKATLDAMIEAIKDKESERRGVEILLEHIRAEEAAF